MSQKKKNQNLLIFEYFNFAGAKIFSGAGKFLKRKKNKSRAEKSPTERKFNGKSQTEK